MKRTLALILVVLMVGTALLTSCGEKKPDVVEFTGEYVYKDSVSTLSSDWNPHTYQTSDESYPIDFITSGLYSFYFNEEYHPVDGKDAFTGYAIVPEMAASKPVDVTEAIKAKEGNPYGIPADMTSGYAYTIDLNKDAKWADGTPINAETYVYSMKQLLDPKMNNYRAADYISGTFVIANGDKYFYQGTTATTEVAAAYTFEDLTKGADGNYYTADGAAVYCAVDFPITDWLGGSTLKAYVDKYGDNYFSVTYWDELVAMMDEEGLVPLNDDTYAKFGDVISGNPAWGETMAEEPNYWVQKLTYEDNYSFDNVGIFASGEYQITLVFAKSLAGFNLLYNLSGNWIVYQPYYDALKYQVEGTDAWATTYNSSVETTMSYGPYKMTKFQQDKYMEFEKNENWYGYSDGKHIYVDPEDGKTYPMYQTTKITCDVVAESATRKLMFLKGQLMTYGLQSEDFSEYRNSDYCYITPSETIFFFIFNGYMDAIKNREANESFDQALYDLETLTLESFRKAIAVTYDKEALCTAVSPARSGGYGLLGTSYLYDPETGARYRDTDQAKQVLCDFYSVDVSKYASLDEAVDSITGYDPVKAKELFGQAFTEALEKGYITDADGDGKCDQKIRIEYASSATSDFITKTLAYLNEKLTEVLVGTPFEGNVEFYESAPLGNNWSTNIKNGLSDTVLGGWSGSALDPFSIMEVYTNPSQQYDAKWFDATAHDLTINVGGKDITMNLRQWCEALNGTAVTVDGTTYNYGDGMADVEIRLNILAAMEGAVLQTYDYIPMLQNAGMSLLTQQCYYVVEEYNPVMGRGGITYLKYNYDETAWAAYLAQQPDGTLSY